MCRGLAEERYPQSVLQQSLTGQCQSEYFTMHAAKMRTDMPSAPASRPTTSRFERPQSYPPQIMLVTRWLS
jgi:hypothetical protein